MHNLKKKKYNSDATTMMLVDRDIIRKLIIPRQNINEKTVVLPLNAYDKIKENSQEVPMIPPTFRTDDIRDALRDETLKEEKMKREIEDLRNTRISDEMAEEERLEKERVLARSEESRREQEDIVKKCNSLILAIQCKAIQDVQIAEKELIKEEFQQYDNSMDDMMEKERNQALHDMQKRREQDLAQKQKYATSILEQIQENKKQRLQEMKRLQREFKLLKLDAEHQLHEQSENLRRESAIRAELKKQNEQINESIKEERKLEREHEKLENIKIQQFLKHQLEEEKKLEITNKMEKQRRERELARLWMIQRNLRSLQNSKDDITVERNQEEMQRKWRQRELETVRRKQRDIEELNAIRERQMHQKRKIHAIRIFEKEKEAEKNAYENEKLRNEFLELRLKEIAKMEQYKDNLQLQIKEKDFKRKQQREEALKEHKDLIIRLQEQDLNVKETIKKKIDQIRSGNMSDMYVKHLERNFDITATCNCKCPAKPERTNASNREKLYC